ncbi:hypothetical protein F8154_10810 [Alkaliphilus pronyensis]|uniref:PqqD family protein n=1 Tax=Alkaliphilus pronyensis TaxID=1482732 RepID=A0A6I0EXC8_9FIRM|nr:hypothetical protein [Alkaliphilus pronyensis]KAB3533484.1 hypothetical protein F8154_10810 [Alkaliphilus pronyensis]
MEEYNDFSLSTVVEPMSIFWFDEESYIKILLNAPKREIFLTRCEMEVWRLITEEEHSRQSINEKLQHQYDDETILKALMELKSCNIINIKKNFLWKDDEDII